ncbi:acyclic terpene utilization AtuA family protein [Egibacter rhizosphaerae]|uniref:Acyclic terpene utilization AtuA family protein n=1 Tax=Egibacter rhizosphaerae TaxID=1670831 RepID=A0A411YKC0_9ACTN|nr:acyclic terpene utilization AtuA family protein [Egibacter rhizosphaerae]QBI21633.1 acyclic terpene utilization AtuA family protein [Egibacter rhizosphaerae]
MTDRDLRVANCSGFFGDRHEAAREMVEGGPIDVLTGDYLAELTMLILYRTSQRERPGYAHSFLAQMEEVLGACLDRGIKVVANAGGLDPAGLATDLDRLGERLGVGPRVAYVTGDDLRGELDTLQQRGVDLAHLDSGRPLAELDAEVLTANAYLGGWPIAAALDAGADVVVCPRVTDAALTVGPASWWFGWAANDWDRLAGAVVAGHVLECGCQATGGNYAFFHEVPGLERPGFPLAEIAEDGSSVITKHAGTGGLVSVGTVTAQLLYEIDGPAYPNPDVTTHLDTVRVEAVGRDRVRLSGTRGSPPPPELKVALNYLGGYRNTMGLVLTGLDIEAKAALAEEGLWRALGGRGAVAEADVRLIGGERLDAGDNADATSELRVTVKDPDPERVGRAFSDRVVELTLANYPGFFTSTPPGRAQPYGVYWPALIPRDAVAARTVAPDGTTREPVDSPATEALPALVTAAPAPVGGPGSPGRRASSGAPETDEPTREVPLGTLIGARSGDKGGNANVGLWARDDPEWAWLDAFLGIERFRELLPEAADLPVRRHRLPNLRALNFVVVGLLGEGVAATSRPDPQAKGLGEHVRSRIVPVPARFVDSRADR